jgi:regulator of protease activity HflC (stomatin/prohibitin superfamily)
MARSANNTFHIALLAVSALIWVGVFLASFTMGSVGPDEVGILINNLFHTQEVKAEQGTYVYNSITSDLILLDKREQTIEFTMDEHRGDRRGRDHIRVKTVDGSDVDVDVTVNYALQPEKAFIILQDCGGNNYKHWIRDYVRTFVRYKLGELTTEEFYESVHRKNKADAAQAELNDKLSERGLQVNSVQVQHFEFYKEYQQRIAKKKLADQEVEEEKSKKLAAEAEQDTRVISVTKLKEIRLAEVKGELDKLEVEAKGKAARIRAEADSNYKKAERQAKSLLYAAKQKAEGRRTVKLSEAKGIQAYKEALSSSEGALNLVMMEYARGLGRVEFTGTPVSLDHEVERFERRDAAMKGGR